MVTPHVSDRATVMVVDDEAATRNTLARLLRREGYEAVCAGDGREALLALNEHTPDLILLDLMMPELDGLELLEILHAHPRWKSLPVIVLTALSDIHCIRRAEQLGAREYLVKAAFSIQEMLSHVRRCVAAVGS